jgi:hypothetical protein
MAGLGRRTFAPGEVLTASNVMNYLQDQAVMNFADDAARGSAIGSAVSDGMVSYLQNTGAVEVYRTAGTAAGWERIDAPLSPNYVINGGFDIWQRGTTISTGAATAYTVDRWKAGRTSNVAGITVSRESSDVPANFVYAAKVQRDSGNSSDNAISFSHAFENAGKELAGKKATISYFLKVGANFSSTTIIVRMFSTSVNPSSVVYNTGGFFNSGNADYTGNSYTITPTTTYVKYSHTFDVPTTADALQFGFDFEPSGTAGVDDSFYVAGVQVEAGQTATPFRRNANSLQGELAACQRYFLRIDPDATQTFAFGYSQSTTQVRMTIPTPVTMRTAPTYSQGSTVTIRLNGANYTATDPTVDGGLNCFSIFYVVSGATANHPCTATQISNLNFDAEL